MAKGRQHEEAVTAVEPAPGPKAGVYYVRLSPCPRRIIETGHPAGEAAEAVARERYLTMYGLVPREGRMPEVALLE